MSARADITAQIDAPSPSEARVASFLVENPHRGGHLSAARLAAEAGASDATVSVVADARRVCIAGFGPAGHLAAYSASQWERLGVPARSMTATGRSCTDDLTALRPGDAVVLLAFDGATRRAAPRTHPRSSYGNHSRSPQSPDTATRQTGPAISSRTCAVSSPCAPRGEPARP